MSLLKKAIIVGKGKTAKHFKKKDHEHEILVAINQAAMFIDYPDFIFANDIEGLHGITEEKFKNTKYLAIPEYPHYKLRSHSNIKFDIISDKCKNSLIIYNICSCPNINYQLIEIDKNIYISNSMFPYIDHEVVSTGDTAMAFLAKFLNIKNFELYGIASKEEYHNNIMDGLSEENKKFSKTWDKEKINKVIKSINILKSKYNLEVKIN